MRFVIACVIGGLAITALAAPSTNHVLHEKRSHMPQGWKRSAAIDKRMILPMKIGLKQSNVDAAHDKLMSISDPDSPNYGDHMSADEIIDFFAPSTDTIDAVKNWLATAGIGLDRVSHSWNKGWLEFEATVAEAEDLLKTEYHQYQHASETNHVACEEYSLPAHIKEHVEIITPTMHFDPQLRMPGDNKVKRSVDATAKHVKGSKWTGPKLGNKKLVPSRQKTDIIGDVNCGTYITPGCLRQLYNIPANGTALNLSSYGIVEYAPQTYLQSDLNLFEGTQALDNYDLTTNTGGEPVGTAPMIEAIDGGYFSPSQSFGTNAESNLDLQYAVDLVYPQSVTLLQVGDATGQSSFNNFLDGIDASYCTFMGGDDPTQDQHNFTSGPRQCGVWAPPKVISTSYGYNEHDLSPAYENRQCLEYAKLGMAGVSFVYSSGDYGVAGNSGQCIAADGSYNNGNSGRFNPAFPSSCPYVTSVGATQIVPGGTVTQPEEACQTVIYSGGGFSNNFAMPSYQSTAVATYFRNHKPKYTAAQYNNSQTTRGFPDVSANGANYIVFIDGVASLVYGTSAASPVFGSIITLINNVRASQKRPLPSLGFLNPVFYKYPGMFNDIKSGGNQGCGTKGFTAVAGWDPVTGLGTPNYTKLLHNLGTLAKVPTS